MKLTSKIYVSDPKFSFGHNFRNIYLIWASTPFVRSFFMLFPKIAFFGIFEHVTLKKIDVRPKIVVRIDAFFFFFNIFFSKMFNMQNKHQKNVYPTKKIKYLMGCLVVLWTNFHFGITFEIIYQNWATHHPIFRVLFRHFF